MTRRLTTRSFPESWSNTAKAKTADHLGEYLEYLDGLGRYSKSVFGKERDIHLRFERAIQLAMEAAIDLANHIVACENLSKPESNSDAFRILADTDFIEENLSKRLIRMVGFRNILVHDYLELDGELEYEVIRENKRDLGDFAKVVGGYLSETTA